MEYQKYMTFKTIKDNLKYIYIYIRILQNAFMEQQTGSK